jgi:hypothetical protein
MPRVVPSQIVAVIDGHFPALKEKGTAAECTRATALAALAALDFVVEDLAALP